MGVEYIRSNPGIEAFEKGMKAAGDRRMQDVKLLQETLGFEEGLASAPSRLSRVRADARIANTAADVADQTKGANVRIAYNTADRGTLQNQDLSVDLGEKRATSPYRVGAQTATYKATAEEAPLGTEDKRLGVSERTQTSPYRVQQTKDAATISGVKAQDSSVAFVKEAIKLYNEGRSAEAEDLARRTGLEIPKEVREDAQMRGVISEIVNEAERRYPNRPASQQRYIQQATERAKEVGIGNRRPEDRYGTVPNTPAISDTGAQKNPTAQQQNIDDLVRRGIARDDKEAFRMLTQSKSDSAGVLNKMIQEETKLRIDQAKAAGGGMGTWDTAKVQKEAEEAALEKFKRVRAYAANFDAPPAGAVSAITEAPALSQPPPAAEPKTLQPPKQQGKPWFWEKWLGGREEPPAAAAAPAAPLAPPKVQERAPGQPPAAPPVAPKPVSIDELRSKASTVDREQVLAEARAQIPRIGRDAVIQRLQAIGVDPTGL